MIDKKQGEEIGMDRAREQGDDSSGKPGILGIAVDAGGERNMRSGSRMVGRHSLVCSEARAAGDGEGTEGAGEYEIAEVRMNPRQSA